MQNEDADLGQELDLLDAMVTRAMRARGRHWSPARGDYSIAERGRYGEGRPDLHVRVDLGRGLAVRVQETAIDCGFEDLDTMKEVAERLGEAIAEAVFAANEIRDTVRDVRAAIRREIAKAGRRGAAWRLLDVSPAPIVADRLGEGPAATVRMEIVGRTPSAQPIEFEVTCGEDVAAELGAIMEEQGELGRHWRALAALGATGEIDAAVHALLVAAGEDMPALYRHLDETSTWLVDIEDPSLGRGPLYWKNATVFRHAAIADGVLWHEGTLSFQHAPSWILDRVVGRRLRDLMPHPAFDAGQTILHVYGAPGGRARLGCTVPTLLFDARSGRAWPQEPVALAA